MFVVHVPAKSKSLKEFICAVHVITSHLSVGCFERVDYRYKDSFLNSVYA